MAGGDSDEGTPRVEARASIADRVLRIFSDVRAGESPTVLLLTLNLFVPLVSYYILKVLREALIEDAVAASYATGAQALLLMIVIPAYGWFASKVNRNWLILGVVLFFVACLELFFFGKLAGLSIGFAFFVWLGIFSLMIISQFWAFANDIYDKDSGDRLFPVIAVGQTVGAFVGAQVGGLKSLSIPVLFQITAGLLLLHLVLYWILNKRPDVSPKGGKAEKKLKGAGGFALVAKSPYLRLVALLFLLLNLVNTTGEYILRDAVLERADETVQEMEQSDPTLAADEERRQAIITRERKAFYGDFFSVVNVLAILIQAFVVSRIVKFFGMRGVLFTLPLIALASYGSVALGAGFMALRWAKTAENSTDYSVMNTGRALLWLPTDRDEKYKAKQTIDAFIVRVGDLASAGLVFFGTQELELSRRGFASANVLLIAVWLGMTYLVMREFRSLAEAQQIDVKAAAQKK